MKPLQIALVGAAIAITFGIGGLIRHGDAEVESARSVIVNPKDDVINYITAREEIPDVVTIKINNVSLNSADSSADFSYNRFYKRNINGESRVGVDKVEGHLTFAYAIPSVISPKDDLVKREFLVKTFEIKVLESHE
ncbi:TPA: hypothetical protein ACIUDF_004504 [Salmonella enterica subsp. enterica serovar Saintpaul]